MAQFQISAPDGAKYNVTAPDDATEADVLAYVQAHAAQAPLAAPAQPDTRTPDQQLEDDMIPKPGPVPPEQLGQDRVGDVLRPVFGGHNPIAETADVIAPAVSDVASGLNNDRPLLSRLGDAAAFTGAVGAQSFQLPTPGQMLQSATGNSSLADAESRFQENNPGIINALNTVGSLTPGIGLGAPNLMPEAVVAAPVAEPKAPAPLSEAASAAARQGVDLPRGVSSDSPIINALSAYTREVPFAGAPLAGAVDRATDATSDRLASIVNDLGGAQSPDTVGGSVQDILASRLNDRVGELANNIGATADKLGTATPLEAGENARDLIGNELASANNDITNRATTVSGQYGGGSAVSAGESLGDTISRWIRKDSNDAAQTVFADVEKQIDPTFKQPLDATRAALAQMVATAREAHTDLPPVYHDVLDAVRNPQGLTYKGLETLRTRIGTKLDDHLTPDVEKAPLKQVYGALSQDTQALLSKAGGPNALGAWFHANKAFTDLTRTRAALTKIVGVSGDASPEAIVDRLTNMAGSTGTADMHRLIQAKAAAGPDAWNELASAIIRKNSDTPATLTKMYNRLSDNGRKILFEGGGRPQLARTLDTIIRDAGPGGRVDEMRQSLEPIIGSTANKSGEAVLDRLQRMAQSRGSDLTNLKYARRIVGEKAWGDVSAAILRRMGQRPNGFDPDGFRADLAKLSPEGHEILFKDHAPFVSTFAEEAGPQSSLAEYRGNVSKVIGSAHAASGEAIVERLTRMAHSEGGADINTLITVKHNVERESPEAWQSVAASILDRMGKTKDGFSIAHWRSEWAQFSESGKRALFSPEHIDALNDIDTYGQKLEKVMRGNTSRTAVWGTYAAMAAQLVHSPLALAAEMAGGLTVAKLLAKPARAKITASWMRQALNTYAEPTAINTAKLQQLSAVLTTSAPHNSRSRAAQ